MTVVRPLRDAWTRASIGALLRVQPGTTDRSGHHIRPIPPGIRRNPRQSMRRLDYRSQSRLRVMVQPDQLTDELAFALARNIARKIENELQYPGQIRITVIRETRCVEFAK